MDKIETEFNEQGLLDFGLLLEPLITTERLSVQKELESWLGSSLSKLNVFATYNIITNVAMLVNSGAVLALTIKGAVNLFEGSKLTFRPLFPELSMTSVLAWKKFRSGREILGTSKKYAGKYAFRA